MSQRESRTRETGMPRMRAMAARNTRMRAVSGKFSAFGSGMRSEMEIPWVKLVDVGVLQEVPSVGSVLVLVSFVWFCTENGVVVITSSSVAVVFSTGEGVVELVSSSITVVFSTGEGVVELVSSSDTVVFSTGEGVVELVSSSDTVVFSIGEGVVAFSSPPSTTVLVVSTGTETFTHSTCPSSSFVVVFGAHGVHPGRPGAGENESAGHG